MTSNSKLDFRLATPHIGADVLNVDLATVMDHDDKDILDQIREGLDQHLVLRFRRQSLRPEQIEQIGRHFGPLLNLKRTVNPAVHIPGFEYLKIISNVLTSNGTPLGDGSAAAQDWHSDGAMKPCPATYTYFYARKVPPQPPKTYWMNAYLVYERLPEEMKRKIANLRVIHHNVGGGNEFPLPPSLPLEHRLIGPRHPLVRVHPSTGRPILYLPHRDDALVVGLTAKESLTLISYLRTFAAKSPYWWGVAMEVDDFVIWDNRPCLHRRDSWDVSLERVIWHLANEGEEPVPLANAAAIDFTPSL